VGESHGASDLKIENADVESKNLPQYISNISKYVFFTGSLTLAILRKEFYMFLRLLFLKRYGVSLDGIKRGFKWVEIGTCIFNGCKRAWQ
jgi:hypothetical protein